MSAEGDRDALRRFLAGCSEEGDRAALRPFAGGWGDREHELLRCCFFDDALRVGDREDFRCFLGDASRVARLLPLPLRDRLAAGLTLGAADLFSCLWLFLVASSWL